MEQTNNPITRKEDVSRSNDEHIDQDFHNYPHSPGNEKLINPQTEEDKINAQLKETSAANTSEGRNQGDPKLIKPHDEEESGHTGTTGKSFATTDFPGNKEDACTPINEEFSDGSGNAFVSSENLTRDDDDYTRIDEK